MAGFYETLMAYKKALPSASSYKPPTTNAVFGKVETTPSIVAISQDNINSLRNSVSQAQKKLATAQQAYNNLQSRQPQQYYYGWQNPAYTNWQNKLNAQQKNLNAAKTALQDNKTALQDAISQQKSSIAAGKDAVSWGLAAKNAEAQGLQNAMKAYQQTMANEGMRNAIMNAAIGTVGNFGGGGK